MKNDENRKKKEIKRQERDKGNNISNLKTLDDDFFGSEDDNEKEIIYY